VNTRDPTLPVLETEGLSNLAGAHHLIGLRTLLALDDIELDVVALFQALVPIHLDRAVVDKYIGSVVTSDKPVPFRVIEPLYFPFVLSHKDEPSSQAYSGWHLSLLDYKDAKAEGLVFRTEKVTGRVICAFR
jgi:hypothetical protein